VVAQRAAHTDAPSAVAGRGTQQISERTAAEDGTEVAATDAPGIAPDPASVPSDGILTLEVARQMALKANPDIHAARARLEAASARIDEAIAKLRPTLALTHTSTRTFHTPASRNRLNTLLQPAQPVPTDVTAEPESVAVTTIINALRLPLYNPDLVGDSNSYSEHSSALTASWLLFDGFARQAQVLAARYVSRAVSASLADLERLIIQAVDAAYYEVQLAEEQTRIAEADEAFSREQFSETEKLRAAGRASQADVDNFRIRALAARANVIAAIGRRETGRVVLAELMGLGEATLPSAWMLSGLAEESVEDMTLPDPESWVERALSNRPDLGRLESLLRSEEENVRAAKALYSPTISLSGSWGFDRSSTIRYTRQDQSTAGVLDLRWDLYTGGARRARVRIAESGRTEAAALLRSLRLSVQAEVRRAIIDLADAQEQIRLQRESLKTARENRRIVQAAYVAGKETLTRLNEAQRDYIEAEVNLALARIRLRKAWSDLRAAGAIHFGEDSTEP
jgi:outer membrane protein TolC